jgi:predicted O-methyltransferase YrrM
MPGATSTALARWCGRRAEHARRRGWSRTAVALARLALRGDDRSPAARRTLALSTCDGDDYRTVLAALHAARAPRSYLEIGVQTGESLALAHAAPLAIGVDPAPRIDRALGAGTTVYRETSDEFFRRWDDRPELVGRTIDLAFIDGLHLFEQALADVLHAEQRADPAGVIVVHDVWPTDRRTASREPDPDWWTGDVWKLVPALRRHRPDLVLLLVKAAPTGLLIVSHLSPRPGSQPPSIERIVAECAALDFGAYAREARSDAGRAPRTAGEVVASLGPGPTRTVRGPVADGSG